MKDVYIFMKAKRKLNLFTKSQRILSKTSRRLASMPQHFQTWSHWKPKAVLMPTLFLWQPMVLLTMETKVGIATALGCQSLTNTCAAMFNRKRKNQYRYRHPGDYDDVIKWKHFPCYWPFVPGIHRSPVNSLHKGQWGGALMFSLIRVWINGWVNNREAGNLRRYRAHYDVIVMSTLNLWHLSISFNFQMINRSIKIWDLNLCVCLCVRVNGSAFLTVMVCRLFRAKALTKAMLIQC